MASESSLQEKIAVNKPLIGVAIAVLVIIGCAAYYWHIRNAPAPVIPTAAAPAAPAPPAEDVVEHPVPAAPVAAAGPLPPLSESDMAIHAALGEAAGAMATQFFVPDSVIRHLVVTIDNLPRPKVAVEKRPTVPVGGTLLANGDELHATLDADNFKRYAPMIDVLRQTDMQKVAAVYFRFYPLFQKAYQDLGYPNGYFNDRLVKVIDSLLATPQVTEPIELVRPNVMYQFADPTLESRPAGQKLLLRMGPDNAAVARAKLTELRAIITAAPPKK